MFQPPEERCRTHQVVAGLGWSKPLLQSVGKLQCKTHISNRCVKCSSSSNHHCTVHRALVSLLHFIFIRKGIVCYSKERHGLFCFVFLKPNFNQCDSPAATRGEQSPMVARSMQLMQFCTGNTNKELENYSHIKIVVYITFTVSQNEQNAAGG